MAAIKLAGLPGCCHRSTARAAAAIAAVHAGEATRSIKPPATLLLPPLNGPPSSSSSPASSSIPTAGQPLVSLRLHRSKPPRANSLLPLIRHGRHLQVPRPPEKAPSSPMLPLAGPPQATSTSIAVGPLPLSSPFFLSEKPMAAGPPIFLLCRSVPLPPSSTTRAPPFFSGHHPCSPPSPATLSHLLPQLTGQPLAARTPPWAPAEPPTITIAGHPSLPIFKQPMLAHQRSSSPMDTTSMASPSSSSSPPTLPVARCLSMPQ